MPSDRSLSEALSDKKFELILLPTERCNFRCTYCYEDFAIGRMRPSTIMAIKELIKFRIPELKELTVSWFGGEPLVAKDIVLDIGGMAHSLCAGAGVEFHGALTTNAYVLTPELFSRLVDIGHTNYQITLDGDVDWHDRTRVLANKEGTFATIWNNLIAYRRESRPFAITLRLHVHQDNIESVKRLYARLTNDLLPDGRFRAYFHKVSNLSGDKGIPQTVLTKTDYASALRYITGASDVETEVDSEAALTDYICYAARPNSLMIRADGRIGKCTVALNDPRNDVGTLCPDGSVEINHDKIRLWFEGYRTMNDNALGCPLSSLGKLGQKVEIIGGLQ